jgi:hypothetical protein
MHSETIKENSVRVASVFARALFFARVFLCTSLLCGWHLAPASDADHCERMNSSELTSPDTHWVLHMYGKVCDLGIMSSAAVIVDLTRSESPSTSVTMLSIDMPSDNALWPKLRWESSKKIRIQLPVNTNIALQMANFQNIDIQITYK